MASRGSSLSSWASLMIKRAFDVKRFLLSLLSLYKAYVSPAFPRRCKYEPTCSSYAVQAIDELGPARGTLLAAWRLLRCNPLSNGGIDDVADRKLFRGSGQPAARTASRKRAPA